MEASFLRDQGGLFRLAAAGLLGLLLLGALAVSWTIPFQEWDAYSIGIWSRFIADGDPILSPKVDPVAHQRPLVPVPQGLMWRWLGSPSMRAARMLSLSFSVLFVAVTFLLARRIEADRTTAWIAAFLAGASPLVTEKVSATMSDIPSAALFWAGVLSMLAAREKPGVLLWLCTGMLWSLSALGKVTALPLCAFFIATTIVYAAVRRWQVKEWLAMAIGLALPGYGVYRYWDLVRASLPWSQFLYGWNTAYYELARSAQLSAFAQASWFGIFLTLIFAAALISTLSARSRNLASLLLAGAGLWAAAARLGSSGSLREYGSSRLDLLLAGVPAIIVAAGLALALSRSETSPWPRMEAEFLAVAALYFGAWLLKLNYDRRFLVAILPPIAVQAARWLRVAGQAATEKRSPVLIASVLVVFGAVAWEGARIMDRGYPVFSKEMLAINRRHGLSPEAKMDEIFGENMRFIAVVQKMIVDNPSLRIISPDTRLPFFFGTHLDASYPTPSNLPNYDLMIWVNNSGILQQYRSAYGMPEPLEALRKTGRLSEIDKTAEYELYRVSRQ